MRKPYLYWVDQLYAKSLRFYPGLLLLVMPACSQDTTSITFSKETGSVADQRFINRYEKVFMTKIPNRRMFKLGYTASTYKGIGLTAAFEYKIFLFCYWKQLFIHGQRGRVMIFVWKIYSGN